MNVKIRKANLSDLKIIDFFQQQIGIHERPLDPTIKRTGLIRYQSRADLKKLLSSEKALVIIAEVDGKPVGCGEAKIIKNRGNWSEDQAHGYIDLMFVARQMRRKGIGALIIEQLIAWLKTRGMKDIRLSVYQKNAGPLAMYRKYGFHDYLLEMQYHG